MTNVLVKWTCSERGACSFILPRPSSLWAEETAFLSVYTFFWGNFSSPTLFAATGQQLTCSWLPFQQNNRLFSFSLWIYLWLAETSQQPISQTTWLNVIPNCNYCNHLCVVQDYNFHLWPRQRYNDPGKEALSDQHENAKRVNKLKPSVGKQKIHSKIIHHWTER